MSGKLEEYPLEPIKNNRDDGQTEFTVIQHSVLEPMCQHVFALGSIARPLNRSIRKNLSGRFQSVMQNHGKNCVIVNNAQSRGILTNRGLLFILKVCSASSMHQP